MKKRYWILNLVFVGIVVSYFVYFILTYESLSYCQKIYRETGNCPEDRCEICCSPSGLGTGCAIDCCEKPTGPLLGEGECQIFALKFDKLIELGCGKIDYDADNIIGATLIAISEPEFVNLEEFYNLSNEYHYKLTFKGIYKNESFTLVNEKNVLREDLPYKVGQFYKFDFADVCGLVFSMGPHGGGKIFVDKDFSILNPFSCW